MNTNNKVSIIIPAYNSEKSIEKCILSCVSQTIPVEVIVVDDGSKDSTYEICDNLKNKYDNIKVIKKENGGVSSARNIGLEYINTNYVSFVDSDDYVRPDMCEKLLKAYEENKDISITICYAEKCNSNEEKMIKSYNDTIKDIICSKYVRGFPWNKLFKSDIIKQNNIKFREDIHVMEDKLFCLEYMDKCSGKSVEVIENLYCYDTHKGIKKDTRRSLEKKQTGLNACLEILKLECVTKNEEIKKIQESLFFF